MLLTHDDLMQTVQAYAECNMNTVQAGKKMNYHCHTVVYHLNKVAAETGLNPRNFYDLAKLLGYERKDERG